MEISYDMIAYHDMICYIVLHYRPVEEEVLGQAEGAARPVEEEVL